MEIGQPETGKNHDMPDKQPHGSIRIKISFVRESKVKSYFRAAETALALYEDLRYNNMTL